MSLVKSTKTPAIKNAPVVGLAEGNGSFNNLHLIALVVAVPWVLKQVLPVFNRGGVKTYLFLLVVSGIPTTVAYWTWMSTHGKRKNDKVWMPGKDIEHYITIKDAKVAKKYTKGEKIPMQLFHDLYFDEKIDINGARIHLVVCWCAGTNVLVCAR